MARLALDFSIKDLQSLSNEGRQPAWRARSLLTWLHEKKVAEWESMSDLPKAWRNDLAQRIQLRVLTPQTHIQTKDQLTDKWSFTTFDNAVIESALITEQHGERRTACVSCMAGCPLGCVFCATGQHGFTRKLSSGEILEQAYRIDTFLKEATYVSHIGNTLSQNRKETKGIDHVVFMGMGEPLLNWNAVEKAIDWLSNENGMHLSWRKLTVSTIGIPEGIKRIRESGVQRRLAWSVHAAEQTLRDKLMPGCTKWPLKEVLTEMRVYAESCPRDITIEYCLIQDVNDSRKDATSLIRLVKELPCKINLIPLNPTDNYAGNRPSVESVTAFADRLRQGGLSVSCRVEKGTDINAACGQLAGRL